MVRDEKEAVVVVLAVVCELWHRAARIVVYENVAPRRRDLDLKVAASGGEILNRCDEAETTM
jgi:hypothetical protein